MGTLDQSYTRNVLQVLLKFVPELQGVARPDRTRPVAEGGQADGGAAVRLSQARLGVDARLLAVRRDAGPADLGRRRHRLRQRFLHRLGSDRRRITRRLSHGAGATRAPGGTASTRIEISPSQEGWREGPPRPQSPRLRRNDHVQVTDERRSRVGADRRRRTGPVRRCAAHLPVEPRRCRHLRRRQAQEGRAVHHRLLKRLNLQPVARRDAARHRGCSTAQQEQAETLHHLYKMFFFSCSPR